MHAHSFLSGDLRRSLLVVVALAVVGAVLLPSVALAQDGASDHATAVAATSDAAHAPKSKLTWFLESSGWIGAIILLLSMYFIATVSRLFFEMRLEKALPESLLLETKALLEQRDFQGTYERLRADDSMFGRVASVGMAELNGGLDEAREVVERTADAETVEMEKKISMMAVLGTLGPMIGLLGTLKGMIASFSVIALSDTQLKASEVAGGISEALLLTFEGVALSVPAIYFFAIFRNRVSSISSTVVLEADEFLRRVVKAGRGAKASAGAQAPTGAAPPRVPGRA